MSNISNYKWGMLILAAFFIDLFQLLLDLVGIGIFINSPIDVFVGFVFQWYFRGHGVKGNWKQWIGWISAPALEFFTASLFPLGWVLEVIVTMIIDKAEKKAVKAIAPKKGE